MLRSSIAVCLLAAGAEAFGFGTRGLAPAVAPRSSQAAAAGGLRMGIDQVEAKLTEKQKGGPYKARYAPVISLFDNVGCPRENKEYKGKKSGDDDDERCVMIKMEKIEWSENSARTIYYDLLPGFNNAYTRSQVSQRIAKLNGEAKAAGLPPAKWPFPPGYLVPASERKSIYDIIPGGQESTFQDDRRK